MGLKDRIIPVPGLLHQKCRSRCRDRSERSNNPGAGTITPELPLPLPGLEPLRIMYMPSQLHGGMVSHMQVLTTLSSNVIKLNTWILTTKAILVLAACS